MDERLYVFHPYVKRRENMDSVRIKKKILYNLFPFLKFKENNLSYLQRISVYVESFLFFMLLFWFVWYIYGFKIFFTNKYELNGLSIYTTHELNYNRVTALVKKIEKKLKHSNIILENLGAQIYLSSNPVYFYSMLYPGMQLLYLNAQNAAVTLDNIIYVQKVKIKKFNIKNSDTTMLELNNLLSHELVHVWQNKKYGNTFFSQWFILPKWVMEGYATYCTKDTYFSKILKDKEKIKHFLEKNKALSGHIRKKGIYKLWGLMVKHAIEHMHKSVDDLHLGKVSYDEVMESLLKEYNLSKE